MCSFTVLPPCLDPVGQDGERAEQQERMTCYVSMVLSSRGDLLIIRISAPSCFGYRGLRVILSDFSVSLCSICLICGRTGCGRWAVLARLPRVIGTFAQCGPLNNSSLNVRQVARVMEMSSCPLSVSVSDWTVPLCQIKQQCLLWSPQGMLH